MLCRIPSMYIKESVTYTQEMIERKIIVYEAELKHIHGYMMFKLGLLFNENHCSYQILRNDKILKGICQSTL